MRYQLVKGFEFSIGEKAKQDGNIESVSVVEEAEGTNISRFILFRVITQHPEMLHICSKTSEALSQIS